MATTWASIASNQGINFTVLQDAVTTGKVFKSGGSTIPATLQLLTKAGMTTYGISTNYGIINSSINTKTSLQAIVKGDLRSFKVDVTAGQGNCGGSTLTQLLFSDTDGFFIGTTYLYTDVKLTSRYVGNAQWYGLGNATSIQINSSGLVTNTFAC